MYKLVEVFDVTNTGCNTNTIVFEDIHELQDHIENTTADMENSDRENYLYYLKITEV